uniref:Uncharacterized protein ycf54 n=1 Tax=Cyanidium caldarium TaxID=2771 RepID=YCF54_CYACA|nr:hypothetical protein JXY51_pgp159 [Cyanidium caldarium]O19890.1 RecName: Full=Uncharacterized protein ycf54 [Cyanidium caldarium]AAB82699.1 unknown [Cyanidium caldarium]WDB00189.1 hypothetical protein CDCA019_067 [Cyanidium caldarium]
MKADYNTYYYIAASKHFLTQEEPLEEILREKTEHFIANNKSIDFWIFDSTKLNAHSPNEIKTLQKTFFFPTILIISSNKKFITWLKLRLRYIFTDKIQLAIKL